MWSRDLAHENIWVSCSPGTRVIFITGSDSPAVRAEAKENGAFAFFAKPFNPDALLEAVTAARADARRENQ